MTLPVPGDGRVGVVLMTFGSAGTAAGVRDYVTSMRIARGSPPPDDDDEVVSEFEARYRRIGSSPLLEITRAQGQRLQALLDQRHGAGRFTVAVGMLHSAPGIAAAFEAVLAAGCAQVVAVTLAPQFSPLVLRQYLREVEQARAAHPGLAVRLAGAWHLEPRFVDSLAERVTTGLQAAGEGTPVLFTAHSLPRRVVDEDPGYVDQLHETVAAVVARVGLHEGAWSFAWQSAGHTAEEWLTPDLADAMLALRRAGHRRVLVAPVQFLADHLEILYDLDVAAREQADAAGMEFRRIAMPNTSAAFIEALAGVVERELSGVPATQ